MSRLQLQRFLLTTVAAIVLVSGAAASACTVPPPPFDPRRQAADVVLLGEITNQVGKGQNAQLAVRRVVAGAFPSSGYAISHYEFDGSGMCPLGPELQKGDCVVVYLQRRAGNKVELRGFLYLKDAVKVDARLANVG